MSDRIRDQEVIIIVSDIHFGRSPRQDTDLVDQLTACLRSYGNHLKELILLGDVFDAYLEYPNTTVPAVEIIRPLLEELLFRNVIVTYHVGNHDPWHLSFFKTEFAISVVEGSVKRIVNRRHVYLSHGDKEAKRGLGASISRHFMRTPIYYRIYRWVLPAKIGQRLPEWVSRKYANPQINRRTVQSLRAAAARILHSEDIDTVIMGHCHEQSDENMLGGHYYNSGSWFVDLSYLEIRPNTVLTEKWKRERPG